MLKVLTDTNVLVDFCLKRQPWYEDARQLMLAAAQERIGLVVPATSLKDVAYLVTKQAGAPVALQFVEYLMNLASVGAVSSETCQQALREKEQDFEDGLVAAIAREQAVDVIISRDAEAFMQASAPKMSAHAFVEFFLHAHGDSLFYEMNRSNVRGLADVFSDAPREEF